MENDYQQIKATLRMATKEDLFSPDEVPLENKMLFVRDFREKSFQGTSTIYGIDKYSVLELYKGLQVGAYYVLTNIHNLPETCIKLTIRPADMFDFFYTPRWVKPNVVYYVRDDIHSVTGPHFLKDTNDVARIKEAIDKRRLYVPTNLQTFEPFNLQKSA